MGLGGFRRRPSWDATRGGITGCCSRRRCHRWGGSVGGLRDHGEILVVDGKDDQLLEFSINQFGDDFHPRGDRYLERFEVEDIARWSFDVEGIVVHKEIMMLWHQNAISNWRYRVEARERSEGEIAADAFCGDCGIFTRCGIGQGTNFQVTTQGNAVAVGDGKYSVASHGDRGSFKENQQWWYRHRYAIEHERGMPDTEDLFSPGEFALEMTGSGGDHAMGWGWRQWRWGIGRWSMHGVPKTGIGRHGRRTSRWRRYRRCCISSRGCRRLRQGSKAGAGRAHDFVVRRKQPEGEDRGIR